MRCAATILAAAFLAACGQSNPPEASNTAGPAASAGNRPAPPPEEPVSTSVPSAPAAPSVSTRQPAHACLTQDGAELEVAAVTALGTEPFWAARTDGRCVTYLTPEDQKGTRIWTRVDSDPQGSVWEGALRGREFRLHVKPSPGCSDGMSDRRYPMEAVLRVDGEIRNGCAEPL